MVLPFFLPAAWPPEETANGVLFFYLRQAQGLFFSFFYRGPEGMQLCWPLFFFFSSPSSSPSPPFACVGWLLRGGLLILSLDTMVDPFLFSPPSFFPPALEKRNSGGRPFPTVPFPFSDSLFLFFPRAHRQSKGAPLFPPLPSPKSSDRRRIEHHGARPPVPFLFFFLTWICRCPFSFSGHRWLNRQGRRCFPTAFFLLSLFSLSYSLSRLNKRLSGWRGNMYLFLLFSLPKARWRLPLFFFFSPPAPSAAGFRDIKSRTLLLLPFLGHSLVRLFSPSWSQHS